MNDANESRLAARLHRELRQLPDRKAPATLAPRVLGALAARQRAPWWRKSWAGWPPGVRLAFLSFCLTLAGGLILAGLQLPQPIELAAGLTESASGWFSSVKPYLALLLRLGDALWLTLEAAPPQIVWLGVALVALAYATCVGLGTLGYRVALNRI